MRHLEFTSITLDSFTTYLTPQTLRMGKLGTGLIFVRGRNEAEPRLGSNGAAKSSIFDGMMWCLYGRTSDGRRGTDLRPWDDPKAHAYVKVVVYVNDTKHVVERSTQTNGLWIDAKVVNQEAIDALLGLTLSMFENSLMMGQGQPLFFDHTPGEKLKVLSDALDLDRWNAHIKNATARTTTYQTAITQLSFEIGRLESDLRINKNDLDDAKIKLAAWDEARAQRQALDSGTLKEDEKLLDKLQVELGEHDLAYDAAETELRHSQRELDKVNNDLAKASRKAETAAITLQAADDALAAMKKMTGKCPTCGQALDKAHVQHRKGAIRELEDACDASYQNAKNADLAKEAIAKDVERHQADVRKYRAASDTAIDRRTQVQSRVMEVKARVAYAKTALKREDSAINPWDEVVQKLRDHKGKITDLLDTADGTLKLANVKGERAKFWVNGFKTVKLYLLEEFLNELEVVTQDMLPRLGLIGWEVQITMEREKKDGEFSTGLTVQIRKPGHTKAVKWESFSGGEAQRLRIAGALGLSATLLRRAGVSCDLIVLDEPTQHMAPEGVDDLVDALVEYGRDHQVFLIDHTARETKRMAAIVTVVREPGKGSRIETTA